MKRNCKVGDVIEIKEKQYIVTSTRMTGGGTGHGPHDVYLDGHQVICKRLKNGDWNAKGKTRTFFQSGCFTGMIKPKKIKLVGKMMQFWDWK